MSKKILSTLVISLLMLSMFAFTIPFGSTAGSYTLTVEAAAEGGNTSYEKSVMLSPAEQMLQPITVGVYLTSYSSSGGIKKDTPAQYIDLTESTNYEIKVPISAEKPAYPRPVKLLFAHWEVWDQDGTSQLEWLNGVEESHTYYGSWVQGGVTYTRITKLVAYPKYYRVIRSEIAHNLEAKYQGAQKELLDRSDGMLEPYLRFGIHNPTGGGDKKLIAVYYADPFNGMHSGWGPETEHLYFHTILSPDAALNAFQIGDLDMMTDLIRTSDIDTLDPISVITSTPGFHMCYIATNMRLPWAGPQNGGEPGKSLRQAMAYLLPKETIIATLFQYIVVKLDTFVPPSLEEWYNPSVTVYPYNPTAAYNTLIAGGWRYDSGLGTWYHDDNANEAYDKGEPVVGGDDGVVQVMSPLEVVAPTSFTIVGRYVDELNALADPSTGNPTPIAAVRQAIDFWTIVLQVFLYHNFEQYFLCWGLGDTPDFLYSFFHSANDIPWGDNSPGIRNPELDAKLEIIMFGMDHDAKVAATMEAQVELSDMLPYIPIYSRNYFNAHRRDYYGIVLAPGAGIDQDWTWLNIKGPRESDIFMPPLTQIQGNETIVHLGEHVESYNPAQAGSAYAWEVLGTMYDSLIGFNPYTLKDKPWLAKSWKIEGPLNMTTPNGANMVNGMYAEYTLDDRVVAGNVTWHDGDVFDASDIMFSWNYIWDNGLTNFFTFYEHLIDTNSPSPDKVVAYWNMTSQWLLYDAAGVAATGFAPQVWGKIDTDGDGLNYLDDGDIEGDVSIKAYTPETHLRSKLGSYPAQAAFPWLSQAIGQGPYVLYSASEDGFHSHLFAFDTRSHTTVVPSVHYWKTKAEIKEQKIEMFYHIGDVTLDAIVDTLDLARMGLHLFETGSTYPSGEYRGFIQEDVTEDGVINILDLATAGKNFGREKEY